MGSYYTHFTDEESEAQSHAPEEGCEPGSFRLCLGNGVKDRNPGAPTRTQVRKESRFSPSPPSGVLSQKWRDRGRAGQSCGGEVPLSSPGGGGTGIWSAARNPPGTGREAWGGGGGGDLTVVQSARSSFAFCALPPAPAQWAWEGLVTAPPPSFVLEQVTGAGSHSSDPAPHNSRSREERQPEMVICPHLGPHPSHPVLPTPSQAPWGSGHHTASTVVPTPRDTHLSLSPTRPKAP